MKQQEKCLNEVIISGVVTKDFELDHYEAGIKYYICEIECKRRNDLFDTIKLMVNEYLVDASDSWLGEYVEVTGEYHTHNVDRTLKSFVMAKTFKCLVKPNWHNEVMLTGYVCKKPGFRKPGGKNVCDVILAVKRYSAADFIPVIFWDDDAIEASSFEKSKKITVLGRIQSRTYLKKEETGLFEKMCWEVSVKGYREE